MPLNGVILTERPYINAREAETHPLVGSCLSGTGNNKKGHNMWKLIKALLYLAVVAGIAFVGYAYVGPVFFAADFAAPSQVIRQPVALDLE